MSRSEVLGIVGAGPFGTALAQLVANAGRDVLIWSQTKAVVEEINSAHTNRDRLEGVTLSERVAATHDAQELAARTRLVVVAVNANEVRGRAQILGDALDGSHLVVHGVGALAEPGDVPVSDVLLSELSVLRVGVLAGPALPSDLTEGRYASMVCASRFDEVTAEAQRLLTAVPLLRVYRGRDLLGVELSAAFAGAYTIALGVADALKVGVGPRAVLVTRAVAEGSRLCEASGADGRTFAGLAGLGNLLVRSSAGAADRSYRLGLSLGRGEKPAGGRVPEGVSAARAALRLAIQHGERAPVLAATVAVVDGKLTPPEAAAMAAGTAADQE